MKRKQEPLGKTEGTDYPTYTKESPSRYIAVLSPQDVIEVMLQKTGTRIARSSNQHLIKEALASSNRCTGEVFKMAQTEALSRISKN